jgi:hypothetical protein
VLSVGTAYRSNRNAADACMAARELQKQHRSNADEADESSGGPSDLPLLG